VTSEDSDNVIRKDLLELSDLIVRHPAVPSQICKIVDEQLQGGISRETYERIVLSLRVLVGHASTRIITESSKILNDEFFDQLERSNPEVAESGTIRFLRELTARYGTRVKDAFFLSFRHTEDDWRTADVAAYKRADGDGWFVELDLMKYSGGRVLLRMSPLSAFQLTHLLMKELEKFPSEVIDEDMALKLRDSAAILKDKFSVIEGTHHLDGYA
jgi:hypothetical protein